TGVQNPKKDWQANTSAAAPVYAQAVQEAVTRGAYQAGVAKAGNTKWQTQSAGIGAQRYPQGISNAGPNWQKGVTPFLSALSSLDLPPRGVKGTNIGRVSAVNDLLHKIKTGGA
ncbi:MAG TPA: hypothetical protein VKB60_00065, partial [Terriglobales bacterium]|nr:hypothetical protein [Terriglobales bacterium]